MAFGGGAPDVFASLSAASGGDSEGVEMGISVLLGSSLFILSAITSLCIIYSPTPIQFNKQFFLRDTIFLLMSLLLLLYAIVVRGRIDMLMSVAFLVLYAVYVFVVFQMDRYHQLQESSEAGQQAKRAAAMTELGAIPKYGAVPKVSQAEHARDYNFESQFNEQSTASYYVHSEDRAQAESLLEKEKPAKSGSASDKAPINLPGLMNENYFGFKDSPEEQGEDDEAAMIAETGSSSTHGEGPTQRRKTHLNQLYILQNLTVKIKREQIRRNRSNSKEHKASLRLQRKTPAERRRQAVQKCFGTAIEKPIHKVCQLTIPITEKEKWNRSLSTIHPTMGLLFMLYSANSK